jgi:hypothetical protein
MIGMKSASSEKMRPLNFEVAMQAKGDRIPIEVSPQGDIRPYVETVSEQGMAAGGRCPMSKWSSLVPDGGKARSRGWGLETTLVRQVPSVCSTLE